MLFKAFQIFLVTFLVVFTTAGAVLLLYGVLSVIALNTSGGIAFVVGGFSLSAVRMIIVIALLLIVAGVSLIARRHRLR
jgi:hypothetical protein